MDDQAEAVMWQQQPRPSRGRKPRLSLDGIVAEAIALADAQGLEGLAMKALAGRLDSGVMSLYRYVPGKQELLAIMLDTALGHPPQLPYDWRPALHRWAVGLRDVVTAHPWALTVIGQARSVGPCETAWLEAELAALSSLELPPKTALYTALAVSSYVLGAAKPELQTGQSLQFGFLKYPETHHRFPHLSAIVKSGQHLQRNNPVDSFEFGLQHLLDGIEAHAK